MADNAFIPHMETVSLLLWVVTSALGAGLCFLVLLVIVAVWSHPSTRSHLDRVSFRILTIALFANMIFGIASAVGGTMTHDGFLCGFSIFVLQLTLQISSFLLFCIALNLQLVVVHGFNGQNMEKYYIIFSLVFASVLAIPPYAANQYGWDPLEQECWYKNNNLNQRLIWQISTQMAWTAITSIAEITTSISVMMFMLKHHVRTRRVFVSTQSISRNSSNSPQVIHAHSYKRIILRIGIIRFANGSTEFSLIPNHLALYPLASCFVNLLSVFAALHSMIGDIHNRTDYNILLLNDFLYCGRAIVYALLAASDPALVRGVKALYRIIRGARTSGAGVGKQHSTMDNQSQSSGLVVHIELTTVHDSFGHELEEERTPKQTETGLQGIPEDKRINEPQPVNSARASLELRRHTSKNLTDLDIRRREEALREEEATFNKQI